MTEAWNEARKRTTAAGFGGMIYAKLLKSAARSRARAGRGGGRGGGAGFAVVLSVCARPRACVRVRACLRACLRVNVCVCVCVCDVGARRGRYASSGAAGNTGSSAVAATEFAENLSVHLEEHGPAPTRYKPL